MSAIEHGRTFVTINETPDGQWKDGQQVCVVEINGDKYIKTEPNETACDNLENLPEF